ncbi:MAG TPA: hypothetical protein VEM14_10380, partial [Gemmatimonadaceae bacterium]|nr:hypothetical protein [Gemmatimonadaceae bacterium]
PFCRRIAPFLMRGPAAVRMLTLRTTVVRDGNGTYVLGKGSALGVDVPPRPTSACAESRVGEGVVVGVRAVQAAVPINSRQRKARM